MEDLGSVIRAKDVYSFKNERSNENGSSRRLRGSG
jgi:hypothetical protein